MSSIAKLKINNEVARIEGVIDFVSVVHLHVLGEQWLANEAPNICCFDFSEVSECNSAATALLLAWLRIAKQHNKKINIIGVPKRLRDLMVLAGLEDILATDIQ